MPCDTQDRNLPLRQKQEAEARRKAALARLNRALEIGGGVTVVIGASGSVAFRGWAEAERGGLTDLCAFRKLQAEGSAPLRMALMRAEAVYGRKLDQRALAAGVHSHDGGRTWGTHAAAGVAVLLSIAGEARAHPGHGAELHQHAELGLLLVVVVALISAWVVRRL